MLVFTAYGRPQQRGSKTPFLIRKKNGEMATRKNGTPLIVTTDDNDKSKAWMACVRSAASEALPPDWELLRGPVVLSVTFCFARPKSHFGTGGNAGKLKKSAPVHHTQTPDLAKLVRALEDAIKGVVWGDDCQVFRYCNISKQWTTGAECAVVKIGEVGQFKEEEGDARNYVRNGERKVGHGSSGRDGAVPSGAQREWSFD